MARQPQGPMAQGHLTTAGTQDAFSNPDDENARSAVPVHFLCEQFHVGVSTWLIEFLSTTDVPTPKMPIRIHCKTGSTSARLVFETRLKCQEFVARFKVDGLPCTVDSHFCNTSATVLVRQSTSPKDRKIGKRFAPLWRVLAAKFQDFFPVGDDKGNLVAPALDVLAQVLSGYHR